MEKTEGKIKRIFLIVLDSFGIGEAPDAKAFGDVGANTLKSVWQTGILKLDNLKRLGFGAIEGTEFLGDTTPKGVYARMREASNGKDTTVGHWEIAGHISTEPLPTFPEGFTEDILDIVRRISGRPVLCNKPYSGTKVIADYGQESLDKNALIVYTSADSVLQIAAHTDMLPLEELYDICARLRSELVGAKMGVGRIIARPFVGDSQNGFVRTADRRDYSLPPPKFLLPEALCEGGFDSIAIGKIADIFADVKFTESQRTHSNKEGMALALEYMKRDFNGLCFVNLVDFDMIYGHRRDAVGYAKALNEFDEWLGGAIECIKETDLLMITADHGCDPTFNKTTDHTREYTPLVIYSPCIKAENKGTRSSFADIGATAAKYLGLHYDGCGRAIDLDFLRG